MNFRPSPPKPASASAASRSSRLAALVSWLSAFRFPLCLFSLFFLSLVTGHSSLLTLSLTNSLGQPDTNAIRVVQTSTNTPALADGTVITIGLPVRVLPDSNGVVQIYRMTGNYTLYGPTLGRGLVYRFPDNSSNATAYPLSGFNTFETVNTTTVIYTNAAGSSLDTNAVQGIVTGMGVVTNGSLDFVSGSFENNGKIGIYDNSNGITNFISAYDSGFQFLAGNNSITFDAGAIFADSFSGNGSGLTHLTATNLTGIVPTNNLPMSQLGGSSLDTNAVQGIVAGMNPPDGVFAVGDSMDCSLGTTPSNNWWTCGGLYNTVASNYVNGIGYYGNSPGFAAETISWLQELTNQLSARYGKSVTLDNSLCVPGARSYAIGPAYNIVNLISNDQYYGSSGYYTQAVNMVNGVAVVWVKNENDQQLVFTNGTTYSSPDYITWPNGHTAVALKGNPNTRVTALVGTNYQWGFGVGNSALYPPCYNEYYNQQYHPIGWLQKNAPVITGKKYWLVAKFGGNNFSDTFQTTGTNYVGVVFTNIAYQWKMARDWGYKVIACTYPHTHNAQPGSGLFATNVQHLNNMIRSASSQYDALFDLGSLSSNYMASSSWFIDQVHPTTTMAKIWATNAANQFTTNQALSSFDFVVGKSLQTYVNPEVMSNAVIYKQSAPTLWGNNLIERCYPVGTNLLSVLTVSNLLPFTTYNLNARFEVQATAANGFNYDIQYDGMPLYYSTWLNQQYYTSPYQLRKQTGILLSVYSVRSGLSAPRAMTLINGPLGAATANYTVDANTTFQTGGTYGPVHLKVAQYVTEYAGNIVANGMTYNGSGLWSTNISASYTRWRWVVGANDSKLIYTNQSGIRTTNLAASGSIQQFDSQGSAIFLEGSASQPVTANIHGINKTLILNPVLTVTPVK